MIFLFMFLIASNYLFYYPIDLHYSQTDLPYHQTPVKFHYPIDLHYSQTPAVGCRPERAFHYPIDLHYSQTPL